MRLVPAAAFLAAAAVALLPGCGPDPSEQAPAVRNMLREFSLAVVKKDDEKILSFVLPMAGQGDNPVGAQGWNTPEGKAAILEGNRRQLRAIYRDAGILKEEDVDRFLSAVRLGFAGAESCDVTFEIAAEGRRNAERVTFRLARREEGWRIHDYFRDML